MIRIAHVINPVNAAVGSILHGIQPVTFESIRVAKEFTKANVDVNLFAIGYEEDKEIIPPYFTALPVLTTSVLDKKEFSVKRKLPLMAEIFQTLFENSEAGYLMFTNMDIALMPQFYLVVSEFLKQGIDALVVNRRGIPASYNSAEQLPLMYSEFGKPHPGFDCFIFHRDLVKKFILTDICVGISFSEVALMHNMIAFANRLQLIDDLHLTFHIGSEVMPPINSEYFVHNRHQYQNLIYPKLKPHLDIRKFPYALLPFYKRMFKWMLNPSFRTHQVAEMEGKNFMRRMKYRVDSVRFSLMEKIK